MTRPYAYVATTLFLLGISLAHSDDGRGLKRGGNVNDVSISGVSSGAAMAAQYAVAHSGSIVGVGSIAGPGWGCADGSISQAINACMCGRQPLMSKVDAARKLAASGAIDQLASGKPRVLARSYVFQSASDATVVMRSGKASRNFFSSFIGRSPVFDNGNAINDSARAGHGIISPDGTDSCESDGKERTYVRRCGAEDNAGKLFDALYGDGAPFDPSKRINDIPESEIWRFNQQELIDQVKAAGVTAAADMVWWPFTSPRRSNFDMADVGYIYVPPVCRSAARGTCRVHVALHGCKQNVKDFATKAGYNNWAEYYHTIVVYPAVQPDVPVPEEVCAVPPASPFLDVEWVKPNPNGCWDWWGYLDGWSVQKNRYLNNEAPQMQVIEHIIDRVTAPLQMP
ncbi:PHB depolymerase family esterase [Paraburkholderia sp. SIMBA_049]